jgi:hypothetical protein
MFQPDVHKEGAMHLIKWKPEETVKKDNAFRSIHEMPWWQRGLEAVGYAAALLVLGEFILKLFS